MKMKYETHSWTKLAVMAVLSFGSMYALMYMMVDIPGNVFGNLNQLYMAGAMTAAMVIIELGVMRSMYEKRQSMVVMGLAAIVLVLTFIFVRRQTTITDQEFLRSMIPHHGAALLMCKNTNIKDPEIQSLCKSITDSQQEQIDFMKTKLR